MQSEFSAESTVQKGKTGVFERPLEKARRVRAERKARGEKLERLNPIQRARRNPKSLKLAIHATCYSCQGGSEDLAPDAGWQWAIGNCTVTGCPLLLHRPYQRKAGQPPEGVYR